MLVGASAAPCSISRGPQLSDKGHNFQLLYTTANHALKGCSGGNLIAVGGWYFAG